MGNKVVTTGSWAASDRTISWRLTLEETAVNVSTNSSTVSYNFEITGSTGTGQYGSSASYWLTLGINEEANLYDITYLSGTRQTTPSSCGYKSSDGVYFFGLGWRTAGSLTTAWLSKTYASSADQLLSGTFEVAHNADGTGTAWIQAQVGKGTSTGCNTGGAIKTMKSDTLTLTPIQSNYIWVYDNGTWTKGTPCVYDGSEWKKGKIYVYNGTTWVEGTG